ncbi:E3 ubiquitin-protein ligase WAV3-like [Rhodamnia argentea]|uniref:E3 ubiquitin-protein ligase WAV3-like n=1 Tax=Rhodamnia argentea TaxID=178133 RepID=A0A8B8P0S3_9MYRT|nr:E3 ubiquitin-protein ligase WAV3-like [Rhodamnia argentea]
MGTGWRRALCSTLPKDPESTTSSSDEQPNSPTTVAKCTKLRFFSNPSPPRLNKTQAPQAVSTPTLRCRNVAEAAHEANDTVEESPKLQCKTKPAILKSTKSARAFLGSYSAPSSPRSPLKLSLFKNSFKLRRGCSICSNSLKAGQGTAIYTAECGHGFHFACVASLVRGTRSGSLACPVCNAAWKDIPSLAVHKSTDKEDNFVVEDKKVMIQSSSPRTPNLALSRSRYDDDEPLSSPRFVPIPESEEAEEVEEFQGFFANSKATQVEVTLLPESAVISASKSHETRVAALRVKAPPAPKPRGPACSRAPVDLVAVLDVSGSMSGAKLQMLKRAVLLVISSLGSADRLSIVAFSASSKRLLPLRRMTARGQCAAREVVDRLACGQGTSVGDALRKATKVLEDRRERNPVASIILLSDGQDERARHHSDANQRQSRSHESSTRFAHVEIPVNATGLGEERASGGYCRREPADDAFAKCVGGLLSVVVRDLRIQLGFAAGSAPAEIVAVYSSNGQPRFVGSGLVRLGDLYAEEERELLVELRVPASTTAARHVLTAQCSYKDPSTKADVYGGDRALMVPKMEALVSEDARIGRLRNLFVVTRALAESRRLIKREEYSTAHQLLASARALIARSGASSADEHVRALDAELAEVRWRRQDRAERQRTVQRRRGPDRRGEVVMMGLVDENGEPLTPTSAWRAAEELAKLADMRKSLRRVSDLHGFENARF